VEVHELQDARMMIRTASVAAPDACNWYSARRIFSKQPADFRAAYIAGLYDALVSFTPPASASSPADAVKRRARLQSAQPVKLTHNASRIANRQTIGWDIFGHYTTRADNGVVSNENAGKDYHTRADPHVIFDDYLCRWRHYLTLVHAMLVPVYDKRVMTQQTVAADLDLFVCRNRRAVIDERVIAYRYASAFVRNEFKGDDVAR
jgi:hypothetical protein